MFNPLYWLADKLQPGGDSLFQSGHRRGFVRGYATALVAVTVVYGAVCLLGG